MTAEHTPKPKPLVAVVDDTAVVFPPDLLVAYLAATIHERKCPWRPN